MAKTNPKLRVVQQLVTPDQAMMWLDKNTHNRTVRQSVVEKYARDMKAGNWHLTHQGILFDWNDVLIDGQHRLWAIIESQSTIEMVVTYGADPTSQEFIDGGEMRQARDVLALRGEKVNPLMVGVGKLLAKQVLQRQNPTRQETVEIYDEYKEAIHFAAKAFPRMVRGVTIAPVLTPIARAFYSEPQPQLIRFATVLSEGMANGPEDKPAILLRNLLLERNPKRHELYGKTERALQAFIKNERISTLYASTEELFLLPIEQEREQARRSRVRSDAAKKAAVVKKKKKHATA